MRGGCPPAEAETAARIRPSSIPASTPKGTTIRPQPPAPHALWLLGEAGRHGAVPSGMTAPALSLGPLYLRRVVRPGSNRSCSNSHNLDNTFSTMLLNVARLCFNDIVCLPVLRAIYVNEIFFVLVPYLPGNEEPDCG